ncbi:RHS repeat domain-containing protein [Aliidiomarina sanyensis]|uniref:Uncharacterized protein n=1 Tax=Aliidiomarina sanyensis TaxID=1249555 RepID=A0A432W587_9GAMM|nr:RHS repeat-associated core domain-containing protein [Aliidiomarina sanyensis]RUO24947.1 hypothetical protein CWE11_11855 [Aliidiomarina sanyensis]
MVSATSSSGWRIQHNFRRFVGENKIKGVHEPSLQKLRWSYSGLVNSGVYHRQYSSQRGAADFAPLAGIEVVAQVQRLTGYLSASTKRHAITDYKYGGLLVNRQGRGLLGFEFLTVHDRDSGIVTQTQYHQQFPLTGQPRVTVTRQLGRLMSVAENTWNGTRTDDTGRPAPVLASSVETEYRLGWNANGSVGNSVLAATTATTFTYDTYGNLKSSDALITSSVSGDGTQRIEVTNTYASSPTRLGKFARLVASEVKTTQSGETVSRTARFEYNSKGVLVLEENPSHGNTPGLRTTYTHDDKGQVTEQTSQAILNNSVIGAPRTIKWTYDSVTGAKLKQTRQNQLTTTYTYEYQNTGSQSGPLVAVVETGANGEQKRTTFNPFGNILQTQIRASVNATFVTLTTHASQFCEGSCANAAIYAYTRETHASGAQSYTFINKLGQVIATSERLLDGRYSQQRTTYDVRGRPEFVYEPQAVTSALTLASLSGPRTRYYYTLHNQAHRIDLPGNRTSYQWREGFWDYQQDPQGNVTSSQVDGFGRTARVRDASNQEIRYFYNVHGSVASVTLPGALSPVTTTYDLYGRRVGMVDQDKGSWSYRYNGFGELIEQRKTELYVANPRTLIEIIEYDDFGRKVRTRNAEGTVCYQYGAPNNANLARGRLLSIKQYTQAVSCTTNIAPDYAESYTYNAHGQTLTREVVNHGRTALFSYSYAPTLERLSKTFPSVGNQAPTSIEYEYANGYLVGYKRPGVANSSYQKITNVNARGQTTGQRFGNGVIQTIGYDSNTGWVTSQQWSDAGGLMLRRLTYQYDNVGNTIYRGQDFLSGTGANMDEAFVYDDLYRMTSYGLSMADSGPSPEPDPDPCNDCPGFPGDPGDPSEPMFSTLSLHGGGMNITHTYQYDSYGNILWKSDVGSQGASFDYQSSPGGTLLPNRLTRVRSGTSQTELYTFTYDGFGNVTHDGQQSFVYSSFDKPLSVTRSSTHASYFDYGPSRELVKQTDVRDDETTVRYLFGGYEVVELPSGVVEYRLHIGSTVLTKRELGSSVNTEQLYMHKDMQGSTVMITGVALLGSVVRQQLNYDPWGKQALIYTSGQFVYGRGLGQSQGYTGHTMVNDFDLIHMGGRTYNPVLGRFMQADPFIQAGANLQNYNRYSYVLNNPMSYTDPSGYLFNRLNKALGDFAPFVAIAIMAMPFGQSLGGAMLKGFLSGGVATGSLRGAMHGAVSAGIFHSIGTSFQERGQFNSRFNAAAERLGFGGQPVMMFGGNALTASQIAGQIGAHAFAGGVLSSLNGAKFSHGFISAGFAKGVGTHLNDEMGNQIVAGTIVSATIGGTTSSIVGGKFANGAVTGAFQALFNHYRFSSREAAIRKAEELVQRQYEMANPSGKTYGVQVDMTGVMAGDIGTFVIRRQRLWGLLPDEYVVHRSPNRNGGIGLNPEYGAGGPINMRNVEAWVVAPYRNIVSAYYGAISYSNFESAPVHIYSPESRSFTIHFPSQQDLVNQYAR